MNRLSRWKPMILWSYNSKEDQTCQILFCDPRSTFWLSTIYCTAALRRVMRFHGNCRHYIPSSDNNNLPHDYGAMLLYETKPLQSWNKYCCSCCLCFIRSIIISTTICISSSRSPIIVEKENSPHEYGMWDQWLTKSESNPLVENLYKLHAISNLFLFTYIQSKL